MKSRKPYTPEEIEEIRRDVASSYPQTEEEKRRKVVHSGRDEHDIDKIIEELRQKREEDEERRERKENSTDAQRQSSSAQKSRQVGEYRRSLSEEELSYYKKKAHEFLDMQGYPEGYRLEEIVSCAINTVIQQELGLSEE